MEGAGVAAGGQLLGCAGGGAGQAGVPGGGAAVGADGEVDAVGVTGDDEGLLAGLGVAFEGAVREADAVRLVDGPDDAAGDW